MFTRRSRRLDDASGKIVLRIMGGAYGDKPCALERVLPTACQRCCPRCADGFVIENDDRLFTAQDVLALSRATGAPMVFDMLHHGVELRAPMRAGLGERCYRCGMPPGSPRTARRRCNYAQQAPVAAGQPPLTPSSLRLSFFRVPTDRSQSIAPDTLSGMPEHHAEVKTRTSAIKCIPLH